jgi:pimeloyl-ACP methyl ester carboxylesterase
MQPVIALHGWLDNAATFDPLMSILPGNLSVLALDLPGHGLSSHYPPGCMYHFTEDLVTLRRIVQYFKWDKVSIMGHSMGSTYAFLYAALFPSQVEKIIGFDILRPYCLDSEKFIKTGGGDIDQLINLMQSKTDPPVYKLNDLVERQFEGSSKSISKNSCKILLSRGSKQSKKVAGMLELTRDIRLKYYSFLHSLPHEFLLSMATKIKCEVCNIKGKQGMYYENVEYYEETLNAMQSSAKSIEYLQVDGTHHFQLNNPENVADIVFKFLSRNKQ